MTAICRSWTWGKCQNGTAIWWISCQLHSHGWGPPVVSWFINHEITIVVSSINHWIQPLINQLNAILGAPPCTPDKHQMIPKKNGLKIQFRTKLGLVKLKDWTGHSKCLIWNMSKTTSKIFGKKILFVRFSFRLAHLLNGHFRNRFIGGTYH